MLKWENLEFDDVEKYSAADLQRLSQKDIRTLRGHPVRVFLNGTILPKLFGRILDVKTMVVLILEQDKENVEIMIDSDMSAQILTIA